MKKQCRVHELELNGDIGSPALPLTMCTLDTEQEAESLVRYLIETRGYGTSYTIIPIYEYSK